MSITSWTTFFQRGQQFGNDQRGHAIGNIALKPELLQGGEHLRAVIAFREFLNPSRRAGRPHAEFAQWPKEFSISSLRSVTEEIWLEIECKEDIAKEYQWTGGVLFAEMVAT